MLRKLLAAVGLSAVATTGAVAQPPYAPYQSSAANEIYNLLFCDDLAAFKPRAGQSPDSWQVALFSEPIDRSAILALASDASQEGPLETMARDPVAGPVVQRATALLQAIHSLSTR